MKVLYITFKAEMYGANTSLYNLMVEMKDKMGVTPSVLISEEGPLAQKCREAGIETIVRPFLRWLTIGNGLKSKAKNVIKIYKNRSYYSAILEMLDGREFDLIHTNSTITDLGAYLAEKMNIPHVWHLREYGIDDYNMYFMYSDRIVRRRFAAAASVIAISQSIYDCYVSERNLCTKDNAVVLYNGIRIPETYQKDIPAGEPIHFCILGMVAEFKGHSTVIEACRELKKTTEHFVVDIIGNGEQGYMDKLAELVAAYGLERNIHFWGYRNDSDMLLKSMAVGLMLSNREAFGRVTVEFMLNYMPVIGTDSGGTREIVTDGTGAFVEPGNAEELAAKMRYYIEYSEEIAVQGENGRRRAEECFSIEANTRGVFDIYSGVLNNAMKG